MIYELIKNKQLDKALEIAQSIPIAERLKLVKGVCHMLAENYLEEACKLMLILFEAQTENYKKHSEISGLFHNYTNHCTSADLIKLLPLVTEPLSEKSILSSAVNKSDVEEVLVKKLTQEGKSQEAILVASKMQSDYRKEIAFRKIAKNLIAKNNDKLVITYKTPLFIIKEYLGIELTRFDKIEKVVYQLFVGLPSFLFRSLKKGSLRVINTLLSRKVTPLSTN